MIQTVNFTDFQDWFNKSRPDNFTYEGLRALFDYLEDYEESMEKPLEFDPIAICCEYTEYENLKEFQCDYNEDYDSIEAIEDSTTVIRIDGDRFIIQQF